MVRQEAPRAPARPRLARAIFRETAAWNALAALGTVSLGNLMGSPLTVEADRDRALRRPAASGGAPARGGREAAAGAEAEGGAALILTLGEDRLVIRLPATLLDEVTGGDLAEAGSPAERALLLELALDGPLARLERLLGGEVWLAEAEAGPAAGLPVRIGWRGQTHAATVSGPGALARLEGLARPVRRPLDLRLPVSVRAGGARVSLATLRRLAPGDLVLPQEPRIAPGLALLHAGGLVAAATYTSREVRLTEGLRMSDGTGIGGTGMEDAAGAAGADAPLDALEVTLSFELARRAATIGELAAAGPGHVMTFDGRIDGLRVRILANGTPVGTGELVEVGEHVGVLVTERADAR